MKNIKVVKIIIEQKMNNNGIIKFKELKQNTDYAIPCRRKNGEKDFITIKVMYDEKLKQDIVYVNNRFMGASLKKIRNDDAFWLEIS